MPAMAAKRHKLPGKRIQTGHRAACHRNCSQIWSVHNRTHPWFCKAFAVICVCSSAYSAVLRCHKASLFVWQCNSPWERSALRTAAKPYKP
eukprot:841837-Prorocentrum_minimum.AAC.1